MGDACGAEGDPRLAGRGRRLRGQPAQSIRRAELQPAILAWAPLGDPEGSPAAMSAAPAAPLPRNGPVTEPTPRRRRGVRCSAMCGSTPTAAIEPARADYNATVVGMRRLHEDLLVLRVRPDAGVPARRGGQFTLLGLSPSEPLVEGCHDRTLRQPSPAALIKRAYSLCSSLVDARGRLLRPEDEDCMEFYIALVRDDDPRVPSLTGRIFALTPHRRIWTLGRILGNYTLEGVAAGDAVLFLATGTGEAPHNAMILDLARAGHRGPVASVVCVRRQRDLGYLQQHRRLEDLWPRYRYVSLTTREPERPPERLQDLLRSDELEPRLGLGLDPASTHVFVCGNPRMVGAPRPGRDGARTYSAEGGVVEILEARGFTADTRSRRGNLHYEAFG